MTGWDYQNMQRWKRLCSGRIEIAEIGELRIEITDSGWIADIISSLISNYFLTFAPPIGEWPRSSIE